MCPDMFALRLDMLAPVARRADSPLRCGMLADVGGAPQTVGTVPRHDRTRCPPTIRYVAARLRMLTLRVGRRTSVALRYAMQPHAPLDDSASGPTPNHVTLRNGMVSSGVTTL